MNESLLKVNRDMKIYDSIVKSAEDKRSYLGLELKNGMKVVLVSDPTTDKSAAAMCVNVGECIFITDCHTFAADFLMSIAKIVPRVDII